MPHSADMEMWLRFAILGAIGFVDRVQVYYRRHGHNMSCTLANHAAKEADHYLKTFRHFFSHFGARLVGRDRLSMLASEAVARNALDDAYTAFLKSDIVGFRQLMAIAGDACPSARGWPLYIRLQKLGWAGPRLYKVIRPLFRKK